LEKTEKTYLGTKAEIALRKQLGLARGKLLDNLIAGHEVDTKFSLSGDWMIPKEAVDQLCLLLAANDNAGTFSIGLLRMADDVLRPGKNRDKKRSISAHGKQKIAWLTRDATMPSNFMLALDDSTRQRILAPAHGTERVRELFRNVTGTLIPRYVIEQVAQQKDPLKRARQMKTELAQEGFQILCAKYDSAAFEEHGFAGARKDDWLSLKVEGGVSN
jgi:hypothetical protein